MGDLTLIYYTANVIAERFAVAVQSELLAATRDQYPIVCVSHKPTDFGDVRIVVGDQPRSIAQVYRNILVGCRAATTPYVAFCEDDTLYSAGHFSHRPALDVFAYNEHRYVLTRRLSADGKRREAFYYYRPRTQMAMGLCARRLMIDTLEERFAKHPDPPLDTNVAKKAGWGEPGRYERNLKLTPRKLERIKWSNFPNVTFNHAESLMGRRRVNPDDEVCDWLPLWGKADDLWQRIHG